MRIPQRAFTWAEKGLLGKDVTFVVRGHLPFTSPQVLPCMPSAQHHACACWIWVLSAQCASLREKPCCCCMIAETCGLSCAVSYGGPMQIGTPGGLGLGGYWAPMLAPYTDLAVSSLADFSARKPPGTPSRATNEGTHQQCFAKVMGDKCMCPC